ncbi:Programmed cell death protein 4 [Holothuria leucospilota]|uniref:Programmed cell death protein 4 n=1 Tax=Holothuria leucospilota TaxID=206669 RepID=A0A9Q0YPS4_HOLLE|nr:Programmed cell death protein 4 [Holothuria leucospilota]
MEVEVPNMNGDVENGRTENIDRVEALDSNDNEQLTSISETEGRIYRKAKRRLKKSPSKEFADGANINGVFSVPSNQKNLRRSRTGNRGLPKKGGAGGKGTWGKPGEVYEEDDTECQDVNDPNYDSETQGDYTVKTVTPKLHGQDLLDVLEPIVKEFFEHGDTKEVLSCLKGLNIHEDSRHHMPAVALTMALEGKADHKEMTSVLLSDLRGQKLLTEEELSYAFDHLLNSLRDLSLDTPDAPLLVGQFIARAIADDCLPPKFLQQFQASVDCDFSNRKALARAELLLNMKHGISRLDNIWGVSGGTRPVKLLSKKMIMLLKEYLSSKDSLEAIHCIQELAVPHFHHELVYEATVIVLESGNKGSAQLMAKLLKTLLDSAIITTYQLNTGFERAFDALPDLVLDVPYAYQLMEQFAEMCVQEKIMTPEFRNKVPARGRKRFVSEGDGGRVKEY